MAGDSLELLRKRAKEALSRGEYQEARRIYQRALIYRSDNVELHYGLATVCFLLNDLETAAAHFKEVIRLDPRRANAYINLGAVYDRMGQYEESLATLQRAIQLDPGRAEGPYNLALVCKHCGDQDKAIDAYREAIRLNPRMYEAYYNLGNILFEKNQFGEAIVEYRRALGIRPNCEKAQSALEAAKANLADGEVVPASKPRAPITAKMRLDPDRLIDPEIHGQELRNLHTVVVDINNNTDILLDFLKVTVEEALRELSVCLLNTRDHRLNLDDQIRKFDDVMNQLKNLDSILAKQMLNAKSLSEELLGA